MGEELDQLSMTHVQYEGTPPGSIFGAGEQPMNELLDKCPALGNWIDLGAGDGRYSEKILASCVKLTSFDIDERALSKLERDLRPELQHKLILQQGDLTKPLPFPDNTFDGAFCASTIHIFNERTIEKIIAEMFRVVKKGGRVVLDYFYDIERIMSDGSLYLYPGEMSYRSADAKRIIEHCFSSNKFEMQEVRVKDDFETNNGEVLYVFNGTLIVIHSIK